MLRSRLEQAVDQLDGNGVLRDEGMCEKSLVDEGAVAGHCRSRREPLVRGDMLHEAEQLRSDGRLREGARAVTVDLGGHLDDVVRRHPFHRAAVADVDDVDGAVAGRERADEADRRLAVESAAALFQQGGLLRQVGIAIELEEAALDLRNRRRARHAVELLGKHLVVLVEVVQVVRRQRAELLEQASPQSDLVRELVAVRREQLRQQVVAVDAHEANPRQVVEADLVDNHALGLDVEQPSDHPLSRDRDVAEADGTVPVVEQRPRHDPDRIREVDDPGAVRRALAHAVGDLEHDGHRAERLAEPARAGRLLPDAAAREWHRLVGEPRLLAPDADLDQHEVGSVDRAIEVVRDLERPVVALARKHARGEAADDLSAQLVDVVQHELAHVDAVSLPREPRHELGRVRRTAADDRDFHPFTPVSVTPSTNAFCARKNRMITGAITSSVAAIVRFHCTWCNERNSDRPICSTQ